MAAADSSTPNHALPERPSREHLRKQAKRLAKRNSIRLADAQRDLAKQYGEPNWASLMQRVEALEPAPVLSPLGSAARACDLAAVQRLLAEGQSAEGEASKYPGDEKGAPLWQACAASAPDDARLAVAEALLKAGANPRRDGAGETALHAAARLGPLALVELLLRHNALEWQPDANHRSALQVAQGSKSHDTNAIVELLHRPVIRDQAFRKAVSALHAGDAGGLARLLDAEPRLLRERIMEPDCYREAKRHQYFRDPKLFWFIASNPTLAPRLPDNIADITSLMIARGVEQADLDYALELVMTSSDARRQGKQHELMTLLLHAGARASAQGIEMTLGHRELEPVLALLKAGHQMTAPIAAALGYLDDLQALLSAASPEERQQALGMAVINQRNTAARLALDAGADPNGFLPVHRHSLPLHQAAIDENIELMALLIVHGARTDIKDKMWDSTPLGWAIHGDHAKARAYLESLAA